MENSSRTAGQTRPTNVKPENAIQTNLSQGLLQGQRNWRGGRIDLEPQNASPKCSQIFLAFFKTRLSVFLKTIKYCSRYQQGIFQILCSDWRYPNTYPYFRVTMKVGHGLLISQSLMVFLRKQFFILSSRLPIVYPLSYYVGIVLTRQRIFLEA